MSTAPSIFGRIVTGEDVEQWCLATLRKWSGTYLAEVERQHGVEAGSYQRVRAWLATPSFDKFPEDQLPAVFLISVGLAEAPLRRGDGRFTAKWQMAVACVCSARSQADSHRMAMVYTAAHRAALLQRQSLDGQASGVVWQDEDYTQIAYDDVRSLAAGQAAFTVEIPDVTTANAGPVTPAEPLDPETDPWADWPIVLSHEETVENHPPSEPLARQEGDADASRS